MSPVIYRPAGSGDPEPERPARVSIAGPGVPTAASFADESATAPVDPAPPVVDLDEDPEIDEDEMTAEAADDLVEDAESEPSDDESEQDTAETVAPQAPADQPTNQRRPPVQRRRRRLLGWGSDPSAPGQARLPQSRRPRPRAALPSPLLSPHRRPR